MKCLQMFNLCARMSTEPLPCACRFRQGTWHGLEVAIKRVILPVLANSDSQEKLRTALREAAINSTLDHPNIVSTYTYSMQQMRGAQVGTRSTGVNTTQGRAGNNDIEHELGKHVLKENVSMALTRSPTPHRPLGMASQIGS